MSLWFIIDCDGEFNIIQNGIGDCKNQSDLLCLIECIWIIKGSIIFACVNKLTERGKHNSHLALEGGSKTLVYWSGQTDHYLLESCPYGSGWACS